MVLCVCVFYPPISLPFIIRHVWHLTIRRDFYEITFYHLSQDMKNQNIWWNDDVTSWGNSKWDILHSPPALCVTNELLISRIVIACLYDIICLSIYTLSFVKMVISQWNSISCLRGMSYIHNNKISMLGHKTYTTIIMNVKYSAFHWS